MNPLILLSLGLVLSLYLSKDTNSPIIKSPNKIDLGNNLFGYPRIQIQDKGQQAPLIIVLHGRGGDETALQSVIPKNIPARIIFLRANLKGRLFFEPRLADDESILKPAIEKAGQTLVEGINRLLEIYPTNKIILFGFSQGGALVEYMATLKGIDGAISFSGGLSSNLYPQQKQNTKVRIWHGNNDKVVPYNLDYETYLAFKDLYYDVKFETGNGKGHILPPKNIVEQWFKEVI